MTIMILLQRMMPCILQTLSIRCANSIRIAAKQANCGEKRKRPRRSDSPTSEESEAINGASHENEDDLDSMATQVVQEKYASVNEDANVPAEHGILERVECYNFMCHDHFAVELGPLINFIVGKNGSGKSAVLTAITLCLGGKASATNRGQSLKSFIKEGKEYVTISPL